MCTKRNKNIHTVFIDFSTNSTTASVMISHDLLFQNKNSTRENLPRIFKAIKDLLEKDYVNTVKIKSASNPSLKGYILNHSGNSYKCKDYLARINNSTHRNTVTKLRTATHCLATASDIYKTDIANNIKFTCKHCSSGEPEDANHLILHCKNKSLIEPRKCLLKLIPYTVKAHPENITLAILNCSFQNITQKTLQNLYKSLHSLYRMSEKLWHQYNTTISVIGNVSLTSRWDTLLLVYDCIDWL